jgi:chromosome segregation ATPase
MAQIRGLDSFEAVLELVKNPKAFEDKAAELRKITDTYHAAIESVVKLDSVNEYTLNIKNKSAQVDQLLERAQQESAKILADAKVESEKAKEEVKQKRDALSKKEKLVADREASVAVAEQSLKQAQDKLALAEVAVAAKEEKLVALEKDLNERKAKLLAAIG